MKYTAESIAKNEVKKAESNWRKISPLASDEEIKQAFRNRRIARLNYKRVKRVLSKG